MVLHLDELAVAGRPAQPQDGTLVNPRMARRHAVGFPGLEQNRRQCVHRFVNSRRTVSFAGRAMKPETNPRGKGILRSWAGRIRKQMSFVAGGMERSTQR